MTGKRTRAPANAALRTASPWLQSGFGWVVSEHNPWVEWPSPPRRKGQLSEQEPIDALTDDMLQIESMKRDKRRQKPRAKPLELGQLFSMISGLETDHQAMVGDLVARLVSAGKQTPAAIPKSPPELYVNRPAHEDVVGFVARVYGQYLDGKYFSIIRLRELDPAAADAVLKYRTRHTWPQDKVPLPSLREANRALLRSGRLGELEALLEANAVLTPDEHDELHRLKMADSNSKRSKDRHPS